MRQLQVSKLELSKLTELATDGASVMTGKRNGVASKLREELKLLLNVHCICHRLALACNDANDEAAYVKSVKKYLHSFCHFSTTQQRKQQLMEKRY